ncbi:DNA primase [Alterisphingorhabdus coralli]|uniref:DNA primase n=1 Tax=Alterisphingorhabdus coralli TaxID=3071408 RepID=A0AA97F4X7_9SPHN|nr:DNA primase [Parasphingorhabdus sp. SCSIO 66989]WOE74098.1 DNA primase [Parasphingorhabdus sp. SCSIO 66989]
MTLSPAWLDQLRSRTTLSSLIGRSIKIQKAGREYKACCPFHNENTPSFTINDQKGFYHCFGCGAHGDAITWMTEHNGLGFMDAVKELASEAGMSLPAPDPKAAERAEKRTSLIDVCAAAQDWFVQQLDTVEGAKARAYLEKRGISEETQRTFGFGYAPEGRGNIAKALDGFPKEQLVEAGLLIQVEDKAPYDRFRGRLMLPIRDARGRVIAFGGRILGEGEPKYLNSPDTPLFDKGRTLYNLDRAAPASRKTNRLLVVEGYMDAIALSQAGFEDVVAPLGTALTEEQIGMAWKLAEQPTLCFDGDKAGQKAAMRAAHKTLPILKPGYSLRFCLMPQGQDPDDFLKISGPKKMGYLIDHAESLADYIWHTESSKYGPTPNADERAAMLNDLKLYAQEIEHYDLAREYRKELVDKFYERFGWNKKKLSQYANVIHLAAFKNRRSRRDNYARAILLGLSRYPRTIHDVIDQIFEFEIQDQTIDDMRTKLIRFVSENPDVEQDMIEQIWEQELGDKFEKRNYRTDLAFSFYHKATDGKRAENDLVIVVKILCQESRYERERKKAEERVAQEFSQEALDNRYRIEQQQLKSLQSLQEVASQVREYSKAA